MLFAIKNPGKRIETKTVLSSGKKSVSLVPLLLQISFHCLRMVIISITLITILGLTMPTVKM